MSDDIDAQSRLEDSQLVGRICQGCGDRYDDDADPHVVECFEVTGKFLCSSCWDEHCEKALECGGA